MTRYNIQNTKNLMIFFKRFIFISLFISASFNSYAGQLLDQSIALKKAGKPYASLQMLKKIQTGNMARVSLEKAENYLLIGAYDKAQELFLEVLENQHIPNNVRKNTQKFLTVLKQEKAAAKKIKHQFLGDISLSRGYNNNVTFANEQDCPDDPVFPQNIQKIIICNYHKNDQYRKLKIKYQYLFRFDQSLDIAGRPVFVNFKQIFNFNQTKFQTIQRETYRFIQLKSQLNFVQLNNWRLGVEYSHDEILRYQADYAIYNSLKFEFTKKIDDFKITPFIKQTRRHYLSFRSDKTGWRTQLGLKVGFSIKQKFATELSFSRSRQQAKNNAFAYNLNRWSLRNTFRLTKKSYIYANLYHYDYRYEGNENVYINNESQEIYQDPLKQKRLKLKLGVRYFISPYIFTELKYNLIRSKANHLLREYKQQTVELAIGFKF